MQVTGLNYERGVTLQRYIVKFANSRLETLLRFIDSFFRADRNDKIISFSVREIIDYGFILYICIFESLEKSSPLFDHASNSKSVSSENNAVPRIHAICLTQI